VISVCLVFLEQINGDGDVAIQVQYMHDSATKCYKSRLPDTEMR